MYPITLKIRGVDYEGSVTDDDAFFFALQYYNPEELKLVQEGKEQEAWNRLTTRWKIELEEAKDDEEKIREMGANLTLKIRNQMTGDLNTRKNVCHRILEIFPTINPKLVYFNDDNRFGIRLQIGELIELFGVVMATAFEKVEAVETNASSPKPSPEIAVSNQTIEVKADVSPRKALDPNNKSDTEVNAKLQAIAQKKQELAALESSVPTT